MTSLIAYIRLLLKLNLFKTIYFNLKVFPFRIAKYFPVYFYGPVKFASLSGKVKIDSDRIQSGMVVFGSNAENIMAYNIPSRLFITGEVVFKGKIVFMKAVQLVVWDNGKLVIGNNCSFGSFTKIVSFRQIEIKNNLLASWECQIFDTDFHYIQDKISGEIYNNCKPVLIGENCWIGNRTSILKGTIIPSNIIVGGNSLCNKDYSRTIEKYSVIAGIPVKAVGSNKTFVNIKSRENQLNQFFWKNEHLKSIKDLPEWSQ